MFSRFRFQQQRARTAISRFCFSSNNNSTPPKFVPKNNSGRIIGGTFCAAAALSYLAYRHFSGKPDQMYSDAELQSKGIFVEDQKLIQTQASQLAAKISLSVKPWELTVQQQQTADSGLKFSSANLKERYYFVLLGHNPAMMNAAALILQNSGALIRQKYYLSPEIESYQNDIANPILLSIDSKPFTLAAETSLPKLPGLKLLTADAATINNSFKELAAASDANQRLYIVDGVDGSAASVSLAFHESATTVPLFVLNYLNEASIFRRFIQ